MINLGILTLLYLCFSVLSFLAANIGKKIWIYIANICGGAAVLLHASWIVLRTVEARRWPFANTYETLVLLSFLIGLIYFLSWRRHRMIVLGGFAGVIMSVVLALTALLSPEVEPLMPALKSNWLLYHVSACFIGYSAFGFASAVACVYLFYRFLPAKAVLEKAETKSEKLEYIDWILYRSINFGYPFFTLGIVTGAIWANESWGRYWNWDPKETWAFITWIVYSVCIHMRLQKKSQGLPTALMTLLGFATVMFTYFGVNFWLASLHAYG